MADDNGVWLDHATGKVVTTKPTRGRQLAAPGRTPTNAEQALIDALKGDAQTDDSPPAKKAPAKKAPAKKS